MARFAINYLYLGLLVAAWFPVRLQDRYLVSNAIQQRVYRKALHRSQLSVHAASPVLSAAIACVGGHALRL